MEAPVLDFLDLNKELWVECDASDFATGAVLSAKGEDDLWHPCAFFSHGLTGAERNYPIYDKELLAIFCAFKEWRHYLLSNQHQTEVWWDHKNLEYFKKLQDLSARQARWYAYLQEFNY